VPRDIWQDLLFEASFGGMRIDVLNTQDVNGRDLATHQSPHRNGARVVDQGGTARVTTCTVAFIPVAGDPNDDPMERFLFFQELKNAGATRTFVHPISGAYQAKIGTFDWRASADERGTIWVDCSFHEDSVEPAIFRVGPSAPLRTGVEDVRASSAEVDAGLVEVNTDRAVRGLPPITTTVQSDCLVRAEEWEEAHDSDTGLSSGQITTELSSLSNAIQAEMDRLQVATDIENYPMLLAFNHLAYSMRRAAQAFLEDTPRLVDIRVLAPMSIYALAQVTYGAAQADQRVTQLLRLNDVKRPQRLPAGLVLKGPAKSTSPRLRSPL
jgi:hypothetical protein